jgi:hypothetical protein
VEDRELDKKITCKWILRQVVRLEGGWKYLKIVSSDFLWYQQCRNFRYNNVSCYKVT